MANILFAEADDVAVKAFTGIIKRSPHTMTHVRSVDEAWDTLCSENFFHLVVMEARLLGSMGKALLKRIRSNPFMRKMPVLIYTRVTDRDSVREMLLLDVQNYLIKPYQDEVLFTEINKASTVAWWTQYFMDKERVCYKRGIDRNALEKEYTRLLWDARRLVREIDNTTFEQIEDFQIKRLGELSKEAIEVGFEEMSKVFLDIRAHIENRKSKALKDLLDQVNFGTLLLEERLKPGMHTVANRDEVAYQDREAQSIRSVKQIASWSEIKKKIEELEGYPVIESTAAVFQMAARDPDIDVEVLVHMIEVDPGLTAQVLFFSNVLSQDSKMRMEDPRQAITMLGLTRMRKLADSLKTIPDEHFSFRGFDWRKYWLFQLGTARLAEEMVKMLSLQINPGMAYYAGLLHEIGKMLLCHFYPEGYENAIEYAHDTGIPLIETEKHYFGCNHEQVGELFATKSLIADPIRSVIAYHRDPVSAEAEHAELVAVVSLAAHLCKRYEIGFSGTRTPRHIKTLPQHPAWKTLKPVLYHGFTIAKFERTIEERVKGLKKELIGLAESRPRVR